MERVRPAVGIQAPRGPQKLSNGRALTVGMSLLALGAVIWMSAPSAGREASRLRVGLAQLRMMQADVSSTEKAHQAGSMASSGARRTHGKDEAVLVDAVDEARRASLLADAARKRAEELAAAVAVQRVDKELDWHPTKSIRQLAMRRWHAHPHMQVLNGNGNATSANTSMNAADGSSANATGSGRSIVPDDVVAIGCSDPLHCNLNGDGLSWSAMPDPRPDQLPVGASRKTWPNIVNNKRTILFCTSFYKYLGNREKCIHSFTGGPLLD